MSVSAHAPPAQPARLLAATHRQCSLFPSSTASPHHATDHHASYFTEKIEAINRRCSQFPPLPPPHLSIPPHPFPLPSYLSENAVFPTSEANPSARDLSCLAPPGPFSIHLPPLSCICVSLSVGALHLINMSNPAHLEKSTGAPTCLFSDGSVSFFPSRAGFLGKCVCWLSSLPPTPACAQGFRSPLPRKTALGGPLSKLLCPFSRPPFLALFSMGLIFLLPLPKLLLVFFPHTHTKNLYTYVAFLLSLPQDLFPCVPPFLSGSLDYSCQAFTHSFLSPGYISQGHNSQSLISRSSCQLLEVPESSHSQSPPSSASLFLCLCPQECAGYSAAFMASQQGQLLFCTLGSTSICCSSPDAAAASPALLVSDRHLKRVFPLHKGAHVPLLLHPQASCEL